MVCPRCNSPNIFTQVIGGKRRLLFKRKKRIYVTCQKCEYTWRIT